MSERALSGFGPNVGEFVFRRGSRALCCGWAPTAAHCSDAGPEGRPVQRYLRTGLLGSQFVIDGCGQNAPHDLVAGEISPVA